MKDDRIYVALLCAMIALVFVLPWDCSNQNEKHDEVTYIDTVYIEVPVREIVLDTIRIQVPVPYKVTVIDSQTMQYYEQALSDLSESLLSIAIGEDLPANSYQDTIKEDAYTLVYDIGVLGVMEKFHYHVQPNPMIITKTEVVKEGSAYKKYGFGLYGEVNTAGIGGVGFLGMRNNDIIQIGVDTRKDFNLKYGRVWRF
jgi:hypothetical protein